MERYIKKMSFLGENIQTIRKHRKMKQQELADAIGVIQQIKHCLFRHIKTGLL